MSFRNFGLKSFHFFAALIVGVALLGSVAAQSGTSTISGSVTDSTGAAVPGATVTISNASVGFSRTVTSNANGDYSFPGIRPATYVLTVEATGFKKAVNNNVQALIDQIASNDIVLEAGDVSVTVDVTTGTIESVVNTTDGSLGNNFVPEQITQLPTELRSVVDLLSLQPGVTREGYVAGGRSDQANITLDGVDINDQQNGGRTLQFSTSQGSVLRATSEAIEEFRITTVGANADQGRSSGAQISLITKSGSNEFHGAGFYFYRPTEFSANDFFNNLSGTPRPSLARDLFGGAIGGKIIEDKLFFFYSYERQYQSLDATVNRTVPLAHLGNGEIRFTGTGPSCDAAGNCAVGLAELNNVIYPEVGINPTALAALSVAASNYPSNNMIIGDDVNTGGFQFNSPVTDIDNTHTIKLDYNINDNQQLFARYQYQWDTLASTSRFPDTASTSTWSHPSGVAVGHNWTIGEDKVNNFRFGFTRTSVSAQGDSGANNVSFRFVFSPLTYTRTLSRTTPVMNITDDFTWLKGDHTLQFGGNVRIIRNKRDSFGSAFDSAVTNPSFYNLSGAVLTNSFTAAGYSIDGGSVSSVQAAAAALIGRYSQYSGRFTFDVDGSVLPAGTPTSRSFATEEYDIYFQDRWQASNSLTITGGVRYGMSRPVYEQNGFQVVPSERLGDFFDRRVASSATGVPLNDLINFELAGPANNGQGFYSMDWGNIQPAIAAAWSPNFEGGFLGALFGEEGTSTIRGGFRMVNDQFGGQLAVNFDGLSTIGFTSTTTIAANTYDVTGCGAPPDANGVPACAPLFTGYGQDIRSLPGIPAPAQLFSKPADEAQRIESSLDGTITSPQHYLWNASYGRSLPNGMYFEASYIGRVARNLFGARDVMALNNLVDPASGMDWNTAAGLLAQARLDDVPTDTLAPIPYFENLFGPVVGVYWGAPNATNEIYALVARDGYDILDWTFVQLLIDDLGTSPNMFFHPQYAAFSSFGTFASSDYHGGTLSFRQRLGSTLSYDFNYTFSKSIDDVSGLSTGTSYGSQFLLNPLRPQDSRALSDFDATHVINANFVWQLPFGKGQMFDHLGTTADFFLGGWQMTGIYRFNTGLPFSAPFDQAQWATNWNAQSWGFPTATVDFTVDRDTQNVFADPQAAYNSFRNALPGETGARNVFRQPKYQNFDFGLQKTLRFPWNENHKLQLRMEVFNLTNVQYFQAFNTTRATWGLPQDPETGGAAANFGELYDRIQGSPRRFQFGVRYEF